MALVFTKVCVDPTTYKEALATRQVDERHTVMQKDFDSMSASNIWELFPL
jgi:hypothetical protein